MPDRLRCSIIETDNVGMPNEYTTRCTAPGIPRRYFDRRTIPSRPHWEEDMVCDHHHEMMYACLACGLHKGTWHGELCAACEAEKDQP